MCHALGLRMVHKPTPQAATWIWMVFLIASALLVGTVTAFVIVERAYELYETYVTDGL